MSKLTQNNLFPRPFQYHITIIESRYRLCLYYLLFIGCVVLIIASLAPNYFYTRAEAYVLIIALFGLSTIIIGVINSSQSVRKILRSFILTNDGKLSFSDEQSCYQLLAASRVSFLGCWLFMQMTTMTDNNRYTDKTTSTSVKKYFMFRDNLSGQDFARLIRVLNDLPY